MMTIHISVNGKPVYTRTATNIGDRDDGACDYKVDTGEIIAHHQKDGIVELSRKLLDTIKE